MKMAKNQTLDDFYKSFREEVLCASDTETSGWTTDDFLTAVMLEYLEEAGEVTDPVICPFWDRGLQMNAYAFSEDFESVDIKEKDLKVLIDAFKDFKLEFLEE